MELPCSIHFALNFSFLCISLILSFYHYVIGDGFLLFFLCVALCRHTLCHHLRRAVIIPDMIPPMIGNSNLTPITSDTPHANIPHTKHAIAIIPPAAIPFNNGADFHLRHKTTPPAKPDSTSATHPLFIVASPLSQPFAIIQLATIPISDSTTISQISDINKSLHLKRAHPPPFPFLFRIKNHPFRNSLLNGMRKG